MNEAETIAERFIFMPPNATMSFGQDVRARRKALAAQIRKIASDAYDKGQRDLLDSAAVQLKVRGHPDAADLLVNDIAPDVKQGSGR